MDADGARFIRDALTDRSLADRVLHTAQQHHESLQVFLDLIRHFTGPSAATNGISKKRKLESDTSSLALVDRTTAVSVLSLPDVSFTLPARKKYTLDLLAPAPGSNIHTAGGLIVTGKEGVAASVPWASIAHAFCVPVPEKSVRAHNFVLLKSDGEQLVFSLGETNYSGDCAEARDGDSWVSLTGRLINTYLEQVGRSVVLPDEDEFASQVPQAGRGSEKAAWVKAHWGSKDGYLFLLPTGILYGFRKPLLFFPFDTIHSVAYTSVLQRTFNMVITSSLKPPASGASAAVKAEAATDGDDDETKDYEFAMLDQADFAGMDGYIKRHGLEDNSLAIQRAAKLYNVNNKKSKGGEEEAMEQGDDGEAGQDEDGETELQRAERELQDQEDEEEEDYDPGSEGESEGEGGSSDEEGGGGDHGDLDDAEENGDEEEA